MAILVDENTRVLVQGITGREATTFTLSMVEYGTQVLAGVTPGKGGPGRVRHPRLQHREGGRGGPPGDQHLHRLGPAGVHEGRGNGGG